MRYPTYFFFQFLLIVTVAFSSSCRSADAFPGVYAGVKLSLNPLGGGMNRTDIVILFRKDKTFTDQLEKKDWKTAVRGNYKVTGSSVELTFKNGEKTTYKISRNGLLEGGGYVLFQMELDNSVPKGAYKFKFISGSGGIATGTTYVGTSSSRELNFDGAGNFSTDRQSTTLISGDNIGGGANSKSDGQGKYTLKEGTLTLKYDNGKTTTHSFFASAGDGKKNKPMAVIDGSFYFMGDDDKDKKSASTGTSSTQKSLPKASAILTSLRKKYGGAAIDALRTYKVEATFNGLKLISYNDLTGDRFRNEMYQNGKLIAIEQIVGGKGWQWTQGKKTVATHERLVETKYNDYIGVLGLRQQYNKAFAGGTVEAYRNGYQVSFQVDGNKFEYLIDADYNIVGDSYQIGNSKQSNTYSNNRTITGITMPFTTIASSGKNKITLTYTKFEVNVPLDTDWKEPK